MVKMFILNNLFRFSPVVTAFCVVVLFSVSACAQTTEHLRNEAFLKEEKNIERSTVLLNNEGKLIPLKSLQNLTIASVNIGSAFSSEFDSILNKYTLVRRFESSAYNYDMLSFNELNDDLKFYNTIIIQVTDQSLNDPRTIPLLLDLQLNKQIIVSLSGDVQSLKLLNFLKAPLIWSEKKSDESSNFAAQLIFGGVAAMAKLKQDISANYTSGSGFESIVNRLKYTVPEEVGINSAALRGIDEIAAEAIRSKAAPGAVVMVVLDGKVIYNKAFGTRTYTDSTPTRINDIYDLASVTKTSATTMAVMRLFEQEKLKLDTNVGAYIPKARSTNKTEISVREVMLHQAGFIPYIPFYRNLIESDFRRDSTAAFPTKVADNYFIRKGYFAKVMWPQMLNSTLANRGKYVYSDLSMYFMKEMVERQSGKPMENYVMDQFYKPLGMTRAGFNPRLRFSKDEIIPTEDDQAFRKTLLEGYVHDQGAAMVGGVSGHAGLFSSTNDLAILYQMLLNRGSYGGTEYFKPGTVDMFTAKQSDVSRRGLGFDRWDPESTKGYPSRLASPQTFGHTGYTGTCVWVDPKYNLVYIFLSNRVNPGVSTKLIELNIRGRIQDVIYEAIGN
ncbi:CubicO group peptidase, beta-lactamase class C family [Daejeonella rubra]|uniref:CubicO group peptidase, beta-lactamase class C family n=2 Tax=Daejeonella rubra TaxID=990371 RepID=A0A1G9WBF6_9SPHI|nr:CubicO group peptidase, beta-lactamase class C family [Daejeonella rubra]